MLLCVWLNRTRLLSREHHQNLLGDSEADGLLLAPLRRLAELLGEVAKADRLQSVRERLAGFVNALSSCIHSSCPLRQSSDSIIRPIIRQFVGQVASCLVIRYACSVTNQIRMFRDESVRCCL